jgi:hypothetical protein
MRAGAIEGRERKNDWHARPKSDFEVAPLIHQPATRTGQACAVIDRRRATRDSTTAPISQLAGRRLNARMRFTDLASG